METNLDLYTAACEQAALDSSVNHCYIHVHAIIGSAKDGSPAIIGYGLSDWHDSATVATFSDGKQL